MTMFEQYVCHKNVSKIYQLMLVCTMNMFEV